MNTQEKSHPFHLVNPSPWPIFTSFSVFIFALSIISYLHNVKYSAIALFASILLICIALFCWWGDVIYEAKNDNAHNEEVRRGLKIGFFGLIAMEAMLFFVFFWAFFHLWISPVKIFDDLWNFKEGVWPPDGIKVFNPWGLPFLNTIILMLSGTTISWAHHEIKEGNIKNVTYGLTLTIILGLLFSFIQGYEYYHASFLFKEEGFKSFYSTIFYILTGFHGLHVIAGTSFLIICFIRNLRGSLKKENHLALDFAAWYWHFVDIIWILLFIFLYIFAR
jgi:cytochrome c oxidase subunit 3